MSAGAAGSRIRAIRLGRAPNCSSLGNLVNVLVWSEVAVATLWVLAEGWRARRTRPEPGGGELRAVDDPPAVVRVDSVGESEGETRATGIPHEAHVQVTRSCALPCPSCHVDPDRAGEHVALATVAARFDALSAAGVFHVAVGGGEGLAHPDLAGIATAAHRAGLSIGLTTSGVGDLDRARGFDQVNVSLDGVGDAFRSARGYAGDFAALGAIRELSTRGERVGVNIVLSRATFPVLGETVQAAIDAGARDIHLLRLKPAGRGKADYAGNRLTGEQVLAVWPLLVELMDRHPEVQFRVDCAMTPFLAAHGVNPDRMRRFGWTGCHGGDALVAVDTDGRGTPCSFVTEGLTAAVAARWREGVQDGACGACAWRDLCRGGCHAVAGHVMGNPFAPDPECPIVAAGAA